MYSNYLQMFSLIPRIMENELYYEDGVDEQAMEGYVDEQATEEMEAEQTIDQGDSSDSDHSVDSENDDERIMDIGENQITSTENSKPTRGLTRMFELKNAYSNTGRKKRIKFDDLGRFKGKYRSKFISFLGDLVREKVGFRVLNWRKVTTQTKDYLWAEITVNFLLF